jgi:hypothetical protein
MSCFQSLNRSLLLVCVSPDPYLLIRYLSFSAFSCVPRFSTEVPNHYVDFFYVPDFFFAIGVVFFSAAASFSCECAVMFFAPSIFPFF